MRVGLQAAPQQEDLRREILACYGLSRADLGWVRAVGRSRADGATDASEDELPGEGDSSDNFFNA